METIKIKGFDGTKDFEIPATTQLQTVTQTGRVRHTTRFFGLIHKLEIEFKRTAFEIQNNGTLRWLWHDTFWEQTDEVTS